ncbi:MAG: hypothetical protein M1834_009562 [Cirrosporium novae-zelandiae]|nr:MAG: hypothetical protein M1834_009562 [Cirrosporium novae-zelandiae]
MSIYLIKGLQMPSKLKWVVVGAFGSRLGVILIIILRIHYINHTLSSNNTNQASSTSSLLTQLQLGYSLISNTIPSLRPFMAAYEDAGPQKSTLKYSGSGANNSYPLSTLNTTTTSKHKSYSPNTALTSPPSPLLQYHPEAAAAATDSEFRPDQNNIHHMALVSHNKKKNKSGSISSSNSQRMMIQKTVDWSIQNEAEAEARERERTMQQQMDYGNRDGNGDGEFGGRV